MIGDETIKAVIERTDIVKLVGATVQLRKAGTLYKGLCPFHDEKTPSFTVSATRNTYHCFGCGAHGDAVRFVMETGALSFPEAVRDLAARAGVEVPEEKRETPEERAARIARKSLKERLFEVQDALCAYYSDQLFGPQGGIARHYLQGRGISAKSAQAFRLGWAPGDKQRFAAFMEQKNINRDDLAALGILNKPDAGWSEGQTLGGGYLRFRERLMCPVVDFRGEVTGFSGRILNGNKKIAKYMNSPETPVFTKGEQLYGAFTARSGARKAGRIVLCEGNIDVISLWQNGFEGSVAAMGTALTPQQARLVKRLSTEVVCIMDGDAAGVKAGFAGLPHFIEAGLMPRAVMLDDGDDPDTFLQRQGAQALGTLIERARPLLDIFIDHACSESPSDPPGRLMALRTIAGVLSKVTDPLALQVYQEKISAKLELSADIIKTALIEANKTKGVANNQPPQGVPPSPKPPGSLEDSRVLPPNMLSTGFASSEKTPSVAHQSGANPIPPHFAQIFEIILQYPHLVAHFHARDDEIVLTQPGLAGFVHNLYCEVSAGQTPNMDRLFSEIDQPEVVAFLRACQSREPVMEPTRAEAAFADAMQRIERDSLVKRRNEIKVNLTRALRSDRSLCGDLQNELEAVQSKLRALGRPQSQGA